MRISDGDIPETDEELERYFKRLERQRQNRKNKKIKHPGDKPTATTKPIVIHC